MIILGIGATVGVLAFAGIGFGLGFLVAKKMYGPKKDVQIPGKK